MYRTLLAFSLAALPLLACTDSSVEDEFAVDDVADVAVDAKADRAAPASYYQLTPDFRRCAAPMCGGVYYQLVNKDLTTCLDGKKAERCYAASTDWAKLGLNDGGVEKATSSLYARDLVVLATIAPKRWPNGLGTFAEVRPTEAWDGQGPNQPSGIFTQVELSGVRCFTTPCPSFRETKLNSKLTANLAEIAWDASGASQDAIDAANDSLTQNKLIIAGDRYTVSGPAGRMAARTVTNFYTRVTSVEETPAITVESHDWAAWVSRFPGSPVSFHVTGTVELPSPGYSVTLVPAAPQGFNPNDLILDLKIERLEGFFPQVITPVEVRYDVTPYAGTYTSVLVREPDGDGNTMTVTTAF